MGSFDSCLISAVFIFPTPATVCIKTRTCFREKSPKMESHSAVLENTFERKTDVSTVNSHRTLLLSDKRPEHFRTSERSRTKPGSWLGESYNALCLVCCRADGSPLTFNAIIHHFHDLHLARDKIFLAYQKALRRSLVSADAKWIGILFHGLHVGKHLKNGASIFWQTVAPSLLVILPKVGLVQKNSCTPGAELLK